ncbi:MAG: pectin acetylesterase-family hydrolase [Polyangiales bacterium]
MTYGVTRHLTPAAVVVLLLASCSDSTSSDAPGVGGAGSGVAGTPAGAAGGGASAAGTGGGSGGLATGTGGNAAGGGAGNAAVGGTGGSAGTLGASGSEAVDPDGDAGVGEGGAPAAGSGGSGGGSAPVGNGDGIGSRAPFEATGMPIMGADNTWTWVPFADTKCRAGTPAGLSVNMNSASRKVMIYLEGGGACFDAQTCGANPDAVGSQMPSGGGVFDRSREENPVRDWSFVYVPYCTGDVHMGAKENGQVEGVTGPQQFVGRKNLAAFLQRLVPTFANAEQVLLTGVSAGGFGASSNAAYVQWAFGEIPVTMIDDSGPTLSNEFLPTCLTNRYVTTWGLEGSILDDCGSACSASEDYSVQFLEYSAMYAEGKYNGLIESDQDSVIRGFFGVGTNNGADDCMGILLFTPMTAEDFLAGLLDYRERVKPYPGFSTFYPSDTKHTWLGDNSFYTAVAGDVRMVDWFQGVIEGKPAVHAGH